MFIWLDAIQFNQLEKGYDMVDFSVVLAAGMNATFYFYVHTME